MASSLAVKRFLSSSLLRPLRPVDSVSRSIKTNTMRQFDDSSDDELNRTKRRLLIRPRYREEFYPDLFDTIFPTRSVSQVLNLMDQFMVNPFFPASRGIAGIRRGWDAKETDGALFLRVEMPGLDKEDVEVSVEKNTLTIEGEDYDEGSGHRYSSRIDLPEKLYKIDEIKAEMRNGVLKVVVPKKKEERSNVMAQLQGRMSKY